MLLMRWEKKLLMNHAVLAVLCEDGRLLVSPNDAAVLWKAGRFGASPARDLRQKVTCVFAAGDGV